MCDAFDAKFFAERFNERFVAISFRAADGMVQVRGNQRITEPMQDVKQRDGVGTAGNADDNGCSGRNQISLLNRRFDFIDQIHNR